MIYNENADITLEDVRKEPFLVKNIKNPSEEIQLEAVNADGLALFYLKNPSYKVQIAAFNKGVNIKELSITSYYYELEWFLKNTDDLIEELQLEIVKHNPIDACLIKNITEKAQIEAVKRNSRILTILHDPNPKVQLAAISSGIDINDLYDWDDEKESLDFLDCFVRHTSEIIYELQKIIVCKYGNFLVLFKNPSRELQLEAIKGKIDFEKIDEYDLEKFIKNTDYIIEELQREIVKFASELIVLLKNPSEEMQLLAVDLGIDFRTTEEYELKNFIENTINLTEEMQFEIIMHNGNLINNFKNISESLQFKLVKEDENLIKYIENPSEKVQLEVIENSPHLLKYIQSPSEKLIIEAMKHNKDLLEFVNSDIKEKFMKTKLDIISKYKNILSDVLGKFVDKFYCELKKGNINKLTYESKLNYMISYIETRYDIFLNKDELSILIENKAEEIKCKQLICDIGITNEMSFDEKIYCFLEYFGDNALKENNIIIIQRILNKNYTIEQIRIRIEKAIKQRYVQRFEEELFGENHKIKNIEAIDNLNGYEFENYLCNLFQSLNYKIHKTGYSRDYGGDIILEDIGIKIVIQAKHYSGMVGNKSIQEVFSAKKVYECDVDMVITNSFFTNGAKETAKKTGTILVDRDNLIKIINDGRMYFKSLYNCK